MRPAISNGAKSESTKDVQGREAAQLIESPIDVAKEGHGYLSWELGCTAAEALGRQICLPHPHTVGHFPTK